MDGARQLLLLGLILDTVHAKLVPGGLSIESPPGGVRRESRGNHRETPLFFILSYNLISFSIGNLLMRIQGKIDVEIV